MFPVFCVVDKMAILPNAVMRVFVLFCYAKTKTKLVPSLDLFLLNTDIYQMRYFNVLRHNDDIFAFTCDD